MLRKIVYGVLIFVLALPFAGTVANASDTFRDREDVIIVNRGFDPFFRPFNRPFFRPFSPFRPFFFDDDPFERDRFFFDDDRFERDRFFFDDDRFERDDDD